MNRVADIPVTDALVRAIKAEIEDQALTYDEIEHNGGPSDTTMTKILTGHGTIAPVTARKLERALGWEPKTVVRIAQGKPAKNPVRKVREAAGLSTYEMARRLGVSARQIERWERGEGIPPDRVKLLSELFAEFSPEEIAEAVIRSNAG